MTKEDITLSIKRVFTDRAFLWVMAGLIVAGIVYAMVVGFNIHASDVTVYSRYTAFGAAHFYKSPWQYLFSFVLFGVVVTLIHLALMVKLHNLDKRQAAIFVGWAGMTILIVAASYALAVMRLGRIS